MTTRRRPTMVVATMVAAGLAAGLAVGCSSDDDAADGTTAGTAPPSDPPAAAEATSAAETDRSDGSTTTVTAATTTTSAPASSSTTAQSTTIPVVPDTGVPGIDSDDVFCRSWSEFAGSFQALAGATSFGTDPEAPARLEVAASPAVVAAVGALDANLPAELEPEREDLISGLLGPLTRRAEQARSELAAAGVAADAVDELGQAWLEALAAAGLDDPGITVDLPPTVDPAAFEAAADSFRDVLPPINQDPSLITDAQTPMTEQFLSLNCPDQGTLGGNDVIDEF